MEKNSELGFGFSKCQMIIARICLVVVSALLAVYIGMLRVDVRKEAVLDDYKIAAFTWLDGVVTEVFHWDEANAQLRQKISEAETYRLFASELANLDSTLIAAFNDGSDENSVQDTTGQNPLGMIAQLSEVIPHIRSLLKEFIDINGFYDARIVNVHGQTLLSALYNPSALSSAQISAVEKVVREGKQVIMPVRDYSGGLMLDVFEPMYSIDSPDIVIGACMFSQSVLANITQFSARPKPEELAEAIFLQKAGSDWEAVVAPKPKPVSASLKEGLDTGHGHLGFAKRQSVLNTNEVYSAVVHVKNSNWAIALEIPVESVEQRLFQASFPIYIATFLGWLAFLLLCSLIWWMGIGRQQKAISSRLALLHQQISRQKELLDGVNISLDFSLFMADVKGQIHICNRAFAKLFGSTEEEVVNQTLFSLLSPKVASDILEHIRSTVLNAKEDSFELWIDFNKNDENISAENSEDTSAQRLFRVTLAPFFDSEQSNVHESIRGAVITMKDITEFRRRSEIERERQTKLIEAFTSVEACADPYLRGHSQRMAELGEKLARSLDLSEEQRKTIVMGAQFSQLGKLFVPRELFSKSGSLTKEELREIQRAPEHAAKILEPISFDLPVARVVYEMYENLDGTGYPRGLKGDEILYESRVLAVLNSYCAMTGDRAYREGLSPKKALEQLRISAFDQEIVNKLEELVSK